jgi:hypothetical protein
VTADAFYWSGSSYINTNTFLFVRNDGSEKGFGVCAPGELSNAACNPPATFTGGGGDINELDNFGSLEMIRLKLAAGYKWVSVTLASLDGPEQGEVRYDNSPITNVQRPGTLGSSFTANANPTRTLSAALYESASYLYILPGLTGGTATNNDYLVWKVEVAPVPEPATIGLLALGLLAVGALAMRRNDVAS